MDSWCCWFDPLFLSEGHSTCTLPWVISLCENKYITDCYNLWTTAVMQMVLFWNLLRNKFLSFKVFNDQSLWSAPVVISPDRISLSASYLTGTLEQITSFAFAIPSLVALCFCVWLFYLEEEEENTDRLFLRLIHSTSQSIFCSINFLLKWNKFLLFMHGDLINVSEILYIYVVSRGETLLD